MSVTIKIPMQLQQFATKLSASHQGTLKKLIGDEIIAYYNQLSSQLLISKKPANLSGNKPHHQLGYVIAATCTALGEDIDNFLSKQHQQQITNFHLDVNDNYFATDDDNNVFEQEASAVTNDNENQTLLTTTVHPLSHSIFKRAKKRLIKFIKKPAARILFRLASFGGIINAAAEGFNGATAALAFSSLPIIASLVTATFFSLLSAVLYLGFDYVIVKQAFGMQNGISKLSDGMQELEQQQNNLQLLYCYLIRFLEIIKLQSSKINPNIDEIEAAYDSSRSYLSLITHYEAHLEKMAKKLFNLFEKPSWQIRWLRNTAFASGLILFAANGFFDGSMLVVGITLAVGAFPGAGLVIIGVGLLAAIARAIAYCCAEGPGLKQTIAKFCNLPIDRIKKFARVSFNSQKKRINELIQSIKTDQNKNYHTKQTIHQLQHQNNILKFNCHLLKRNSFFAPNRINNRLAAKHGVDFPSAKMFNMHRCR